MAQNPRFNNSDMFTGVSSNDYSDIAPDSTSEVLATQGNVINSIKVFWNKLRAKLAYAISRPSYNNPVGGNYVPIFVNADGVAQECQPTTVTAGIAGSGIITIPADTIPNENIYTGTTVCINVSSNSASSSNNSLQIQHNNAAALVKYPSGVTVLAKDISDGELLLATFCKTGSNSTSFWILLNKVNTVVSKAINDGYSGLMSAADKEKLDGISPGANVYTNNDLPNASYSTRGVAKLGKTGTITIGDTNKTYPVQVDSNGRMGVSVQWTDNNTHYTALLKAGGINSKENQNTTNGNTYLQIVEDDAVSSQLNITGTKGVSVTSDKNGTITIEGQGSTPILQSDKYDDSTGYLVLGPGRGNNTISNYLRGDGSWGQLRAEVGFSPASSLYTTNNNNSPSGNFRLCYASGSVFNCVFILPGGTTTVGKFCTLPAVTENTHSIDITYIPIEQPNPEKGILLPGRARISVKNYGTTSATIEMTIL